MRNFKNGIGPYQGNCQEDKQERTAIHEKSSFASASIDAAADFLMRVDKPRVVENVGHRVATMNVAENEAPPLGSVEREQFRRERADVAVVGDIEHPQGNDLVVVL